jgi:hypothetical protein
MVLLTALLVAHISALDGRATIAREGARSSAALRNEPVLTGDTIATFPGSRAEIQLDPNVCLRLDQSSRVQIVALAYGRREVRLVTGNAAISMLRADDAPQIDTPVVALHPAKPGLYRVAASGGQTTIDARSGTILVSTPNGTQVLQPGEDVTASGSPQAPVLQYAAAPPSDAFDAYNANRDTAILAAQKETHLSPALAGYANLAAYGGWIAVKGYGTAWRPHEFAGWAPYHSGSWRWRSQTGWVWIPREPWGWLPFHYGGWAYDSKYGWCWIPPRTRDPSWTPANAIFFATISAGRTQDIGWVPLAPGEPTHAHLADYRNARSRGAITLVTIAQFRAGHFSRPSFPTLSQLGTTYQRAPSPSKM